MKFPPKFNKTTVLRNLKTRKKHTENIRGSVGTEQTTSYSEDPTLTHFVLYLERLFFFWAALTGNHGQIIVISSIR